MTSLSASFFRADGNEVVVGLSGVVSGHLCVCDWTAPHGRRAGGVDVVVVVVVEVGSRVQDGAVAKLQRVVQCAWGFQHLISQCSARHELVSPIARHSSYCSLRKEASCGTHSNQ